MYLKRDKKPSGKAAALSDHVQSPVAPIVCFQEETPSDMCHAAALSKQHFLYLVLKVKNISAFSLRILHIKYGVSRFITAGVVLPQSSCSSLRKTKIALRAKVFFVKQFLLLVF